VQVVVCAAGIADAGYFSKVTFAFIPSSRACSQHCSSQFGLQATPHHHLPCPLLPLLGPWGLQRHRRCHLLQGFLPAAATRARSGWPDPASCSPATAAEQLGKRGMPSLCKLDNQRPTRTARLHLAPFDPKTNLEAGRGEAAALWGGQLRLGRSC